MSIYCEMSTAERHKFIRETFNRARNDKEHILLLEFSVTAAMKFQAIPTELGLRIIKGLSKIKGKS